MGKTNTQRKGIVIVKDLLDGSVEVVSSEPVDFIYCIKRAEEDMDILQYGEGNLMSPSELANAIKSIKLLDALSKELVEK